VVGLCKDPPGDAVMRCRDGGGGLAKHVQGERVLHGLSTRDGVCHA
jgi:hypothetical protein